MHDEAALMTTPVARPSRRGYRWIVVWLTIGGWHALLLSWNAIRDYRYIGRYVATQQVRHQLTQMAVLVEQQLRRSDLGPNTLKDALAASPHAGESVNLRDPDGSLLEHFGDPPTDFSFTMDQVHETLSQRDPLFRTRASARGELVVEVFPMRGRRPVNLAAPAPPTPGQNPTNADPGGPRPLLLEIALPLKDADKAALAPLRSDLAINLGAAASLLITILITALGLRSYVRGRKLEEQVEIARQVQSRLLPHPTHQLPGVEIATEYQPSEQIGGDFYDFFTHPSEAAGKTQPCSFLIGDVSGKGIPAALLMGVIHGAVRTAPWQHDPAAHEAETQSLNRLLCEHSSGNRFASLFWAVHDPAAGELRFVNAGHCPPMLLSRGSVTRLTAGGPVLGLLPEATYEATTITVAPGDLLLLFSDGVVEATSPQGEEYGDDRLAQLLESHPESSPADFREELLKSLAAFTPAANLRDDLTFALIRIAASPTEL